MKVMRRARNIMAEVQDSGALLRREPMGPSYEGPARWRMAPDVYRDVQDDARSVLSEDEVLARDARFRLYGYPLYLDVQAEPGFLILEPDPEAL